MKNIDFNFIVARLYKKFERSCYSFVCGIIFSEADVLNCKQYFAIFGTEIGVKA